jgi:hypothetical protein
VRFGDITVPAGSPIALGLATANKTMAARFTTPSTNRAHLAFGVGNSPHACPAKEQALHIATTAVDTLLTRLAGLRLAVPAADLALRPSIFASAHASLPVVFDPQPAAHEGSAPGTPPFSRLVQPTPAPSSGRRHSAPTPRRFSLAAMRRGGR